MLGGSIISISDLCLYEVSYRFGDFEVSDKGSVDTNLVPSQVIGENDSLFSEEIILFYFFKLSMFIVDFLTC